MRTVGLLILSNTFMTAAWYGHLKFKAAPLVLTILVSWLIALPEYALQVPANRYGHGEFSAPQLKIIQEAISISVFVAFSSWYLRETPNWRTGLAIVLILAAVALAVTGDSSKSENIVSPSAEFRLADFLISPLWREARSPPDGAQPNPPASRACM